MLFRLAELLDDIKYEKLPKATVEKVKIAVQNYVGGSVPAVDAALTKADFKYWKDQGINDGDCVIMGYKGKTSVLAAASVNAAMGEIYLSEDMHNPTSSHPGMLVIPVAIAFGERANASGKQVIEAIVAGYEAMGRIGAALLAPDFAANGMRPASTVGPFGGAVAAVKAMGLGKDAIARAITIAGNTCSGVMEFVNAGTDDICIQNSLAAKNSCLAAEFAANGITASPTILEGRFGLGQALNDRECDWEKMFEKRNCYVIDETVVKAYPGCGYIQCSAQAIMELTGNNKISPRDVEKIDVGVCRASKVWPGVDNPGPFRGPISAMMSHQFMVSSAILKGYINIDAVKDFANSDIEEFARKVVVSVDRDIESSGGAGCRIKVYLKDGRVVEHYVDKVKYLDKNGVVKRLKSYASPYFSESVISDILSKSETLDKLKSIRELSRLLEGNNN